MRNVARSVPLLVFAALAASCGRQESASGASPSKNASTPTIEERGRAAFSACAICHSTKDPNGPGYAPMVGPSLFGVYGAKAGHIDSYDYSQAMREANLTWDEATLDKYIASPQEVVPQTRMAFVGERDPEKRDAIIAYLKTLK